MQRLWNLFHDNALEPQPHHLKNCFGKSFYSLKERMAVHTWAHKRGHKIKIFMSSEHFHLLILWCAQCKPGHIILILHSLLWWERGLASKAHQHPVKQLFSTATPCVSADFPSFTERGPQRTLQEWESALHVMQCQKRAVGCWEISQLPESIPSPSPR